MLGEISCRLDIQMLGERSSVDTCYMCDQPKASMEHAPPKCIFPEEKDIATGTNYRKNLITVPSCDTHNSQKSKDDEYLLQVISSSITSNDVGLSNFLTKVARAYNRRPQLAKRFTENASEISIGDENGNWEEGAAIKLEHDRLDRILLSCARALYWWETKNKMLHGGEVITPFTYYLDDGMRGAVEEAMNKVRPMLTRLPRKGENPEVFWYSHVEGIRFSTFYMCFYGATDVFIRFKK